MIVFYFFSFVPFLCKGLLFNMVDLDKWPIVSPFPSLEIIYSL